MSSEQDRAVQGVVTSTATSGDVEGLVSRNDIEQVRELLFGDYSRDYESQFRYLHRQVDYLNNNLQRLIDYTERLEREKTQLQENLRDHQLRSQLQSEELRRFFQERLREQQREFDVKLDGLLATVHQLVDDLDGKKLDSMQMAEMVVDLGMRIKRSVQKPAPYTSPRLVDKQE